MMRGVKLHYLILLIDLLKLINGYRVFEHDDVETILAFENEDVIIQCKTDMPISYCGFIHPSGNRYSSNSENNGNCAVRIKATQADVGEWKCHIGMQSVRVEMMKRIELRVVGRLAAVQANITTTHGQQVTLACATTNGLEPLSYCRFEPPNASPFSIDATVESSAPILNKYYFPPNRSLDRGDCAVTIRRVNYEDAGIWTCGGALDDGQEHIDHIKVEVEGLYTMSTISVTAVTIGGILIAALMGNLAYIAWKRRWILGSRREQGEMAEAQEMHELNVSESAQAGSLLMSGAVPTIVIESPSTPSTSVSTP